MMGEQTVRRLAESDLGVVDKTVGPTTKVRKFISPEDIKDEIDMSIMSKQLEDWEKVSTDDVGYLKLKLKYLQRKNNKHLLKLITNTSNSVTEENIFDIVVEDAMELITTVRRM